MLGNEIPREGVIVPNEKEIRDLTPNQSIEDAFGGTLDTLIHFAHRYPRQISSVEKNAFKELEAVPGLAQRAYYSIPYKEGGTPRMVEGLSIKASSALTRHWGNCGSHGRVAREDGSNFYAHAIAIDFESLIIKGTEWRVSKFYKPRGGQGLQAWDDTMMRNQVMAGISKARRNVELLMFPEWLKTGYFEMAKDLVVHPPKHGHKIVDSVKTRIIQGKGAIIKDFGVTPEEIETYVTENMEGLDDASVLTSIVSLYTGLKDGTVHVEKIFNRKNKKDVVMPEAKK
jgi:hypothetical protein